MRPKIIIKYKIRDFIFEILGIMGLICLLVLPIYFYKDLPACIPKHFNIFGQADSYGHKGIIWLLPSIGLLLYIGMTWLGKIPHLFNYPTKVTAQNAERLYTSALRTLRVLKSFIILIFAYLNFKMIKTGLTETTEIAALFLPFVVLTMLIIVGLLIYKMIKN